MYYAKEKGRNNYQFFSGDMKARAQERLSVENYLRLALRRNELVLHYQPRMRMSDGALVGVEALIRWQHPRRGLSAPTSSSAWPRTRASSSPSANGCWSTRARSSASGIARWTAACACR
jgi:hypothetical protein